MFETLLNRLSQGLSAPIWLAGLGWPFVTLIIYASSALILGRATSFLPRHWLWPPWQQLLSRGIGYLLMPAFGEELVFRGLLLPHSHQGVSPSALAAWVALSVGLFVLYHPLAARLWYPQGRKLFDQSNFLLQCTLLGLACGLAYCSSGSLWWAVLIHWLAVFVWLEPLQGRVNLKSAAAGQ